MCLIFIAIEKHPTYKLIIAANRDEFYERPTAPACFWDDAPGLLAGRDLRAGGTWLGITTSGRIAAITNYRDPASITDNAPSRGELVSGFLLGKENPVDYLARLKQKAGGYNGFNLIVGHKNELCWFSNRGAGREELTPGIHGLSNGLLNTPWPKVTGGKEALARILSEQKSGLTDALFDMLADRSVAEYADLPDTGVGIAWERTLSSIFIASPMYGTRSSTVILIDGKGNVIFIEKSFDSDRGKDAVVRHAFRIAA
ncbi:MAG: NRDE family protein [Deltaproteobacteria bacterium]|nr:NRDE family protein [Deltaproteobacteria bacterium]